MSFSKYLILFLISLIPYVLTLTHDVIDIDSSQYAEIAREMIETGEFFHLKDNGKNYLDKPILTFWTIASSYKIFGISNFAYRLPAFLITLLSFYSIFRITTLISGSRERGILASLAYSVAPGVFAMLIDPKIDVYLVAYLTFAFHAYYLGVKQNSNWFYLMYLFISMGFITKGPISMVIPALAIGGDILVRRDWKLLLRMKVLSGILIVASLPAFWSYLLYQDFSSHGPVFFLWIQSFGRFYRQMYNQKFDPLYFVTNYSWAFAGFILPIFYTMFLFFKNIKQNKSDVKLFRRILNSIEENKEKESYYVIYIWLFVFLFLISFSRYQLPQYIYWALPAGAIFISRYIEEFLNIKKETNLSRSVFQNLLFVIPALLIIAIIVIPLVVLNVNILYGIPILVFLVALLYFKKILPVSFIVSVLSLSLFFSIVGLYIYPELTSYQPSNQFGAVIRQMEPDKNEIFTYRMSFSKRSYAFYAARFTKPIFDREKFFKVLESESERLVVVSKDDLPQFQDFLKENVLIEVIAEKPSYKVATPKADFFLKEKRPLVTKNILLIKVKYVKGT
ncbi:MAG TPA: glycosyltransferase family 39 protein [Leptospiraceae bacterium]|nr:glycosyltransferase family 39 protein [Leptospiraceae bacterium]HMW05224.1 glycosyltransferase family 39 protein [Leptospiraceae bacterium]HMX31311.1 glycosyltransferase family 39 protein [Leptospiraceae bacterium]HMY32117.1 glycosyltransferase family 39 protein [Leptospiraceae bacterium]HMZ64666.1 glycosyltransferase family 39 protein [Leptospiraceae bacterium]